MSSSPNLSKLSMFSADVLTELKKALQEIGPINPWFDEAVSAWVFEHPAYPESASGNTPEATIEAYQQVLAQWLQQRMAGRLAPYVEAKATGTAGRGGARPGAGRPRGTHKILTRTVRVPAELAHWLQAKPEHRARLMAWFESESKRA
ncbi:MAG: hypothetical protein VKJ06_08440 [Vampirovibrionales bacterium]|nr:hypothetical protein [Vampirovibrionales bacterium]